MSKFKNVLLTIAMTFLFVGSASAHIVVKPADATTGSYQTFVVGVPNESESSVVMVKLVIPESVSSVTPTVKQGWTIETEKTGTGEAAVVKSITWKGGNIGSGLRDDFTFSAKTPDTVTDLQWKAYETDADGKTISWDKTAETQPKKADGSPDFSASGPFSVTKVAAKATTTVASGQATSSSDTAARTLAGAALAVSIASFALVTRKKK